MVAPFSFFWHDYETFGRNPRRDRPAQFAGVRTDADLNEVEAPVVRYCRPTDDWLPDPEACLLTGITPQTCLARGVPEPAFAAEVERCLGAAGTVGVGYNSIRFDDEVTRHLFWRNLIDPYAREWRHECGRWDLLDAMRCARALRPDGLQWPTGDDGQATFRLEKLTAANGVAHESAHDALSDVRATLAVARLLRQRQPRLWEFCLKLRHKDAVWAEIGVGAPRPFLHVSGRYPVERGCLAVVWPLGPHPTNRNELIVWDLSVDPAALADLDAATIRERLFVRAEGLPDGVDRLPIKTIHVNRSPIVVGNVTTLSAEQAGRWGLDVPQALRHAERAARLPDLRERWAEVFARAAPAQAPDADEDLYGGFIGPGDRRTLERLRGQPPARWNLARVHLEDARLQELCFRYRARNAPEALTDEERARWEAHRSARLHRGEGGATTLAAFFERIDALSQTVDEAGEEILAALYEYAESIAPPLQ
jgi:exodeoxyribonuclease-1